MSVRIPVDRARQHLRLLLESGYLLPEVGRAAGMHQATLHYVLHHAGSIHPETEETILAVSQADVRSHCLRVSPRVATRMVRALTARGWTPQNIADAAHLSRPTVTQVRDRPRRWIEKATDDLIERAYDTLFALPAPKGPVADRMRALARSRGWTAPKVVAA